MEHMRCDEAAAEHLLTEEFGTLVMDPDRHTMHYGDDTGFRGSRTYPGQVPGDGVRGPILEGRASKVAPVRVGPLPAEFLREDIYNLLQKLKPSLKAVPLEVSESSSKASGGAPPKYNWELIYERALELALRGPVPKHFDRFVEYFNDNFSNQASIGVVKPGIARKRLKMVHEFFKVTGRVVDEFDTQKHKKSG